MRQRKRKSERKFLLSDKSFLRLLSSEQRKELDAKYKIIYPSILLVENAQHGLDKPSALLNLENTVNVPHWAERAKMDLLVESPSNRYRIGSKIPINSIYKESGKEREKMERLAISIVQGMKANADKLKNMLPVLRGDDRKFMELAINHKDIPDNKFLREFNLALREFNKNHPYNSHDPILKGIGNKKIPEIRKFLDRYKRTFTVDSLEAAYEWTTHTFHDDPEFVLDFLCNGHIIPVTTSERAEIFNRFRSEGGPPISRFAPYALTTTRLYLTMFMYLLENRENSSPQEVLRDFEYLYYALDDNITFVSAERWHKKCIEEIPLLKNVRKNFKYIIHKNKSEEEYKKGLRSLGIKV